MPQQRRVEFEYVSAAETARGVMMQRESDAPSPAVVSSLRARHLSRSRTRVCMTACDVCCKAPEAVTCLCSSGAF